MATRSHRGRGALPLGLAVVFSASLATSATAQDLEAEPVDLFGPIEQAISRTVEPLIEVEVTAPAKRRTAATIDPAVAARVVTRGKASSGAVALTFDDGTNVPACRRIARTLRQRNAKGTFFINGNHLKNQPRVWRGILKGMPVANHTRSHYNLTTVSDRVVTKQIRENEWVHERILGKQMLKMLRPPYGAYDSRTLRIAGQLGYGRVVLWSVDTFDWRSSSSAADIARRAKGAPPGSVILMHCSRSATADALPSIIRHYKKRGIKLAGLRKVLRR